MRIFDWKLSLYKKKKEYFKLIKNNFNTIKIHMVKYAISNNENF
jgi:hypothetical protein